LQLTHVLAAIGAIFRGESWKPWTGKAEGGVFGGPVGADPHDELVVVEVQMEVVQLEVGHRPHVLFELAQREVFPADIEHEAALAVAGIVAGAPTREMRLSCVDQQHLQDRARSIEDAGGRVGAQCHGVGDGEGVPFIPQRLFRYLFRRGKREKNVSLSRRAVTDNR
jgi:hypothetical protein